MDVPRARAARIAVAAVVVVTLLVGTAVPASACSCRWEGPFLQMAPRAPLIIRAKILAHPPAPEKTPQPMDVQVAEVLHGDIVPGVIRVWLDNGALCRPSVSQFPVDTEWVIALNGPGSKVQPEERYAISVCGQYWVQVKGDQVIGNLDDAGNQNAQQAIGWAMFHGRLRDRLASDSPQEITFTGEVRAGERFEKPFGGRFRFILEPIPAGWTIVVREEGRDEDLSRLTPPFHGTPNPRDIEGWHFRNADNTGPNEPGPKNVNAPGVVRKFIFSPDVGKTIDGSSAGRSPTPEEIEAVRRFGSGTLRIVDYRVSNLKPGREARFEWMKFGVRIMWMSLE